MVAARAVVWVVVDLVAEPVVAMGLVAVVGRAWVPVMAVVGLALGRVAVEGLVLVLVGEAVGRAAMGRAWVVPPPLPPPRGRIRRVMRRWAARSGIRRARRRPPARRFRLRRLSAISQGRIMRPGGGRRSRCIGGRCR